MKNDENTDNISANLEIIQLPLDKITPDPENAKDHPQEQIEQIKESIRQFGNDDPIGVWGPENIIVEGHGRYQALLELGYKTADCIRLDHLTDEQRRAYALAHNQTTMSSGWLMDKLDINLDSIKNIDMTKFGFNPEIPNAKEASKQEPQNIDNESKIYIGAVTIFGQNADCILIKEIDSAIAEHVLTKVTSDGADAVNERLVSFLASL